MISILTSNPVTYAHDGNSIDGKDDLKFLLDPDNAYFDIATLEQSRNIATGINTHFPNWLDTLPDCPCTKTQLEKEHADWTSDSDPVLWRYHDNAEYGFRSPPVTDGKIKHGQQCTYDKNGMLIINGEKAGTPDFWHSSKYHINHLTVDVDTWEEFVDETRGLEEYHETWTPNKGKNMCANTMLAFAVDKPNTFSFLMFAVQDTNGDIYTAQLESANFESPLVSSELINIYLEREGWQKEYKGIQLDIEIPDTFQQIANDPENPKYTLVYLGNCVSPLKEEIEPSMDLVQSYFADSAWGYPVGLIYDEDNQYVTFSSDSCENELPNLQKVDLSSERQITFFEQIPRNISKFFLNFLQDSFIDQISN